mgnify:CR=1 FL=1
MALQKIKRTTPKKVIKKVGAVQPVVAGKPRQNKEYTPSIGRRKVASARIRLFAGKGESEVNGKSARSYFFSIDPTGDLFLRPFKLIGAIDGWHATVKVGGSGLSAQLDAATMGIARALVKRDEDFRRPLREAGMLTRDPRMKESRKMGQGGSARRKKQSPKR